MSEEKSYEEAREEAREVPGEGMDAVGTDAPVADGDDEQAEPAEK